MSPFFLTRCAQKCLEHLIRHYQIHIFNVTDIMRCILPFHNTKFFARMIKLLRFTGTHFKLCPIARVTCALSFSFCIIPTEPVYSCTHTCHLQVRCGNFSQRPLRANRSWSGNFSCDRCGVPGPVAECSAYAVALALMRN